MFGVNSKFVCLLVGGYFFVKGCADSVLFLGALPLFQVLFSMGPAN